MFQFWTSLAAINFDLLYRIFGIATVVLFIGITFVGVRFLAYWWSFLFQWKRYRLREQVSTRDLQKLDYIPNIKIQITTRGSYGSSEVILRGISNIERLVDEAPEFYGKILSVELITESDEQADLIKPAYALSALNVDALVVPRDYETPNTTKMKARGLHYAVEMRRIGWNNKPGRTFIVHYDEESVMVPAELRKLIASLAGTDKKILEGPIYYPLEYMDASVICRAMEANRPVGCFECRHVMENGTPLHLHGSNLIVDESLENEIGWDIGCLDGQPFIAEDYVFGMNAFVTYGKQVFGWHGCVMLEQPPFSFKSAFKQRHRWIFGVMQGMDMIQRYRSFKSLPLRTRTGILWGTRYRIATFALGAVVGALSTLVMPFLMFRIIKSLINGTHVPLFWGFSLWLALVGIMWLGSVAIGAWYNVADAGLNRWQRVGEIAKTIAVAPIAGILESAAGFWAVYEWSIGRRSVNWNPTPKTKLADTKSNTGM